MHRAEDEDICKLPCFNVCPYSSVYASFVQGWELSVPDQRRLYLLISDTLGSEGKAVESQKVSLQCRLSSPLEVFARASDRCPT